MRKRIIVFAIIIMVLFSSCTQKNNSDNSKLKEPENIAETAEIKAVWLNYYELADIIKSSENEQVFESNVEKVIENCKELKINRIFLQVRPYSDAFYVSEIFPSSNVIDGIDKKIKNFDPLKIFCQVAHKHNISLDAWINPYRISSDNDIEKLSDSNPATQIYNSNPNGNDIVILENGIYYNPASQKAKRIVLDGIREIIENYDVDGIHIDDYFYPTADKSFDEEYYNKYTKSGGKMSLSQWRKENVNSLVSSMYSAVKSLNDELLFSISPCGNIKKNENELFADVELWCSQDGFADIIIPQLYFGFENDNLPFKQTADEWNELFKESNIKLCVGLAPYKCGAEDKYAGDGKLEWVNNTNILKRQIEYSKHLEGCSGFSLYSYSHIILSKVDENKKIELQNVISVL